MGSQRFGLCLLLVLAPLQAQVRVEAEDATLISPSEIELDSGASGGEYVHCGAAGGCSATLAAEWSGATHLALGCRSSSASVVGVAIEELGYSTTFELQANSPWTEMRLVDLPSFTGQTPYEIIVTCAATGFDFDYCEIVEAGKCLATSEEVPMPAPGGLESDPNKWLCGFLGADQQAPGGTPNGVWNLTGTNFSSWSSVGAAVGVGGGGSGLTAAAGKVLNIGSKAIPLVGVAVGAGTYVYVSVNTLYGQILSFSAQFTDGTCDNGGATTSPCLFHMDIQIQIGGDQNYFGNETGFWVTVGDQVAPPYTITPGAINGGDTATITVDAAAICGASKDWWLEWGGTSWYQPFWDFMSDTLHCGACQQQ